MPVEALREATSISPAEALLRSWGFEGDALREALKKVEDPKHPQNLVIDCGTTALDCVREGDFSDDPNMGGLALIGVNNRDLKSDAPFEEPPVEAMRRGRAGGIANAANFIARLQCNEHMEATAVAKRIETVTVDTQHRLWAVMARLGDDTAGQIYREKIHPGVDKELLAADGSNLTSGLSDVRVQQAKTERADKGDRAIYFRAGAGGAFVPNRKDLLELYARQPFNVNISYPGLFPDGMDRDNGRTLRALIEQAQKFCPMVTFDVHGFTQMHHIEPALEIADGCNANLVEAIRIFLGKEIDPAASMTDDQRNQFLDRIGAQIQRRFFKVPTSRTRLFTISDRGGCALLLCNPEGRMQGSYCASLAAAIPAKDKTGAGDVRFGTQRLFIAKRKAEEWKNGTFGLADAQMAVQVGQLATTLHIQGQDSDAFNRVTLERLERAALSGQQFPDLQSLRAALVA